MLPMNNYHDVFIPTEQGLEYNMVLGVITVALIVVGALLMIWMLCGLPGIPANIPSKKYKKIIAILTWVMFGIVGGAIITGGIGFFNFINYQNKVHEVENNMKHNIEEKYGARLQDRDAVTQQQFVPDDLDQPHNLTLIFTSEDASNPVSKMYSIRFDRNTSEPFASEVPGITAPTAAELELNANQ
jgi:hypothetical protein